MPVLLTRLQIEMWSLFPRGCSENICLHFITASRCSRLISFLRKKDLLKIARQDKTILITKTLFSMGTRLALFVLDEH